MKEEYLKDFNGTRAYLAARGDSVTPESANTLACELLTDIKVMEQIVPNRI